LHLHHRLVGFRFALPAVIIALSLVSIARAQQSDPVSSHSLKEKSGSHTGAGEQVIGKPATLMCRARVGIGHYDSSEGT
jgi:hypothetical protein